jgi:hypothetical protein
MQDYDQWTLFAGARERHGFQVMARALWLHHLDPGQRSDRAITQV